MAFIINNSIWVLLLIAAFFIFLWLYRERKRLEMHWAVALVLSLAFVIVSVLLSMAFARLENLIKGTDNGNMSLYGGLLGLPIIFFIGAKIGKRNISEVFDIFTIPALITVLFARMNCLFAGCCLGLVIPGTTIRWPVREIEIVFYILLILFLGRKIHRKETYGEAYPIYMFAYSLLRTILEFFRVSDSTGIFHLAHLWAILAFVIGISVFLELRKRQKNVQAFKHKK